MKGSPPHARGKVLNPDSNSLTGGITPARAGKSVITAIHAVQEKDHPRTRGEKGNDSGTLPNKVGSPPHARGKD